MQDSGSENTENGDYEAKEQEEKMQHWLLCCDPQSERFFAVNLDT